MAPHFLRDQWRRSTSSFRKSEQKSTDSTNSSGVITQASSIAGSVNGGTTPPLEISSVETSKSFSDLHSLSSLPPPVRPTISTSSSNRHSVSGMSGLGSPAQLYTSPYAPRVENVAHNSTVHQKVMVIWGVIGGASIPALDGQIMVSRLDDAFPPVLWPVSESNFKALVYLQPGPNTFRLDFTSPKLANNSLSNPIHSTTINIHMVQPLGAPPLQLVILLGKDSPATFDTTPARIEKEGNNLETAIRKFRMAAYLWQAYTAEQIQRNRLGRRTFRMEEEWTSGSSNYRDRLNGTMRSEAKVHVVRCKETVEELRDIDRAQQNPNGTQKGELINVAHRAMKDYFQPLPNQKQYCAVMFLDTTWDKTANLIRGHAAQGCVTNDIALAIFGSHALHSYPSSFEEVVPAFTDCTPTDTNFVANDCNESGSSWEAANIGIGAHLHEVGHLFGCPHQEHGVMQRDYVTFGRTFITREPYSTRTKAKGGLVLAKDECVWHRLDLLRFRCHPCFALPLDRQRLADDSISAWPVEKDSVVVTAASGVLFLEVFSESCTECHFFIEYNDTNGNAPKQITLTEQSLRASLTEHLLRHRQQAISPSSTMRVCIKSRGGGNLDIDDFARLASKASRIKLPNGRAGFRSMKLGLSQMEGSTPEELVFHSVVQQTKLLTQVRVYHGNYVDGLEFIYEDSTSQLFGSRRGTPGGSDFSLDTRKGEVITGFVVRSGLWIDAIAIMTSLGRQSPLYGQPTGGSLHKLIPPIGYSIAGVTGSCADWVDGFGVLITR